MKCAGHIGFECATCSGFECATHNGMECATRKRHRIESFFVYFVYLCGESFIHPKHKHGKQQNDNDRSQNHYQ